MKKDPEYRVVFDTIYDKYGSAVESGWRVEIKDCWNSVWPTWREVDNILYADKKEAIEAKNNYMNGKAARRKDEPPTHR